MASIIPARPLPPGPVNTVTIYDQLSSYTVAAGAYLYGVDLISLFYYGAGTLINKGGIFLDSASEFGGVTRFNPDGLTSSIDNQGVIVAYGRDLGGTSASFNNTQVFNEFTHLTNSGQIFSISEKAHAQVLSSYLSPQITNSGLLAAYSGAESATVVFMQNGGHFVNTATGVVLAEGRRATGLVVDNSVGAGVYEVENAGRIEAASIAGGEPSVGIFSEYSDIRNTGLIKADIALAMSGVVSNAGRIQGVVAVLSLDMITVVNEAGGVIAGDIEGGLGQDRFENSGRVEGNGFLSAGNDTFLNLGGGVTTGVIDLGLGDDVYAGHSGLDRVAGDNGQDQIDGAGGNDLLIGGNDTDRIVGGAGNDGLYGERGADVLVTLGGDHADGGREDDRVELGDYRFAFAGGGTGTDTLVLPTGARVLELGLILAGGRVAGFEIIALAGSQVLIVNPGNVAALADGDELRIDATATDRVELVGAWTAQANVDRGGTLYRVYTLGLETVLVKDGAAVQVLATPTPGAVGLDAVAAGAAALVPGEASGLTLTPDELQVTYLELFEPTLIYQGETWFTIGSAPAVFAWRDSAALDNQGTLAAFNDVQATAIALQFTNLAGVVNDGLIYAESTGAIVNVFPDYFPVSREGAYAIQDSLRVINRGDVQAYSLNGMAVAMGELRIDPADDDGSNIPTDYLIVASVEQVFNEGWVEAISELSWAVGIVGPVEFENDGDIYVAGADGAIGVVASQNVQNRGTIQASSLGAESIGLLLMSGGGPYVVSNSGTIAADIAIQAFINPHGEEFALELDNSGWIEGRIHASLLADSLVNTGDILGEVLLGAGDDAFDGSGGTQSYGVFGEAGNDILIGGVGDDFLSGDGGNDSLTGGAGADWLFVAAGQSSAAGGSGSDLLAVDFAGATLAIVTRGAGGAAGPPTANPGGGQDGAFTDGGGHRIAFTSIETFNIATGSGADVIRTGAGDDVVTTGAGKDTIETGGGMDHLDGGTGADSMAGGAGDDSYVVDNVSDSIVEAAGGGTDHVLAWTSYTLGAGIENLTLEGSAANGTGNAVANLIVGNASDNVLDGKGGADRMEGGLGNDTYGVDSLLDQAVEAADGGNDTVISSIALTLGAHLENLKAAASAAGLALTGNDGANALTGGNGNDVLNGGLGNDQLAGGLGNDVYLVGPGDSVVEAPGAGSDEIRTALAAYTLGADFEKLTGLAGTGQALTGNGLANLVTGGSGSDVLDGGASADQLAGGLGNDVYFVDAGDVVTEAANAGTDEIRTTLADSTLAANAENFTGLLNTGQTLRGNALGNVFAGGAGADRMVGGLGNDIYLVGAGDNVIESSGAGSDEVRTALAAYTLTAEVERLTGTSATGQTLIGNALANVIAGGAGNDILNGGLGGDQMAGGLGNDVYFVDPGDSVTEAADGGIDEIRTTIGDSTLSANVENFTGLLNTGQTLRGNALGNLFAGGSGADRFVGGAGDDVYLVGTGDNVIESAGAGTDEVRTGVAAYTLTAEVERLIGTSSTGQKLTGNALANVITGGAGNDVLNGGLGADEMAGGLGNDVYFIDSGDVVTEAANAGTDEVRTTISDSTAGANIENLTGLLNSGQTLRGNALNNLIAGGAGADLMIGGLGNDIYLVGAGDTVTENAGEGTDEVRTALAAYTLAADLERLTGTSATGQALTGNGLANVISGGAGNDVLNGGLGADQMAGGFGNDVYFVDTGDSVAEAANAGIDEVRTTISDSTAGANIENLTGLLDTGQTLRGNALGNLISGGTGADRMVGGLGDDVYIVGAGDNVIESAGAGMDEVRTALAAYTLTAEVEQLTGTSAAQTLTGNALANILTGGAGVDTLAGGGGADAFRYLAVTESNAASRDHIIDFTPGTDKIELDRIDASRAIGGDQAFNWIGSNAFSKTAGELRAFQSGPQWIVEGDINGDGFADLVIALTLQGATPLGAGDFVL